MQSGWFIYEGYKFHFFKWNYFLLFSFFSGRWFRIKIFWFSIKFLYIFCEFLIHLLYLVSKIVESESWVHCRGAWFCYFWDPKSFKISEPLQNNGPQMFFTHVGCKSCDSTHDGVITTSNNDSSSRSLNTISWEKGYVFSLKRFDISLFTFSTLWFRLSSQGWVINLSKPYFYLFKFNFLLTFIPATWKIRRSAGIRSPPLTSTMSPRTSSRAAMDCFSPFRKTRACCGTIFAKESIIFEDFASW